MGRWCVNSCVVGFTQCALSGRQALEPLLVLDLLKLLRRLFAGSRLSVDVVLKGGQVQ